VDELPAPGPRRPRRVGWGGPYKDPNVGDYTLKKQVGVAQIAYSEAWQGYQGSMPHHFTTKELFDELAYHGIHSVRLWLTVPFWDGVEHPTDPLLYPNYQIFEDMSKVWEHPDIDTILLILTNPGHTAYEEDICHTGNSMTWLNDPVEEAMEFLYKHFGDQDKTIIFANTETDNQWRGFHCTEPDEINFDTFWGPERQQECFDEYTLEECVYQMGVIRFEYALRMVERRQRLVEEFRARHPDSTLKFRTSITISAYESSDRLLGMYALSRIRYMKYKPDYIGLSHWNGNSMTLTEAIHAVKRLTRYPEERLIIDQIGANERKPGAQYPVIIGKTHEAWDEGVNSVFVWMWKATWRGYRPNGDPANKGMWWHLCQEPEPWCGWGEPTSGLDAIYELIEEAQEE